MCTSDVIFVCISDVPAFWINHLLSLAATFGVPKSLINFDGLRILPYGKGHWPRVFLFPTRKMLTGSRKKKIRRLGFLLYMKQRKMLDASVGKRTYV